MARRSPGVRSTFAAPRFSSSRCSLVVPEWEQSTASCKQPSRCELSRCCLLLLREFTEQINQRLVRLAVLRLKAWDGVAEIRVIELRIFVDLACEKTLTKWAKWNESDPEFFKCLSVRLLMLPSVSLSQISELACSLHYALTN
jgi:hypothetical protein